MGQSQRAGSEGFSIDMIGIISPGALGFQANSGKFLLSGTPCNIQAVRLFDKYYYREKQTGVPHEYLRKSNAPSGRLVLVLIGVGSLHVAANMINDYYDDPGSDQINLHPTPFSGGSRVIQEQLMDAKTVWAMAMGFFVLGTATGVWLVLTGRPFVAVIGLMGFLAGYLYSASPISLMSRGLGEVTIFLAFGPLITWGTYYVMTELLTLEAFLLGIPLGLLITAVIWINQFPDLEADRDAGKRNWVVRLGRDRSRFIYALLMLGPYAVVLFWVLTQPGSWPYSPESN